MPPCFTLLKITTDQKLGLPFWQKLNILKGSNQALFWNNKISHHWKQTKLVAKALWYFFFKVCFVSWNPWRTCLLTKKMCSLQSVQALVPLCVPLRKEPHVSHLPESIKASFLTVLKCCSLAIKNKLFCENTTGAWTKTQDLNILVYKLPWVGYLVSHSQKCKSALKPQVWLLDIKFDFSMKRQDLVYPESIKNWNYSVLSFDGSTQNFLIYNFTKVLHW